MTATRTSAQSPSQGAIARNRLKADSLGIVKAALDSSARPSAELDDQANRCGEELAGENRQRERERAGLCNIKQREQSYECALSNADSAYGQGQDYRKGYQGKD